MRPDYGLLIYCDENSYGLAGEERSFGFSARAVTNIDPAGINNLSISDSNEVDRIYDVQGNIL